MSIDNLAQQYIPATLDGLTVIQADQIYIGDDEIKVGDYVPYSGATKVVDLNSQIIKTTHTAATSPELVNLGLLNTTVDNLSVAVAGSFLSKVTTSPQTVIGNVSYTAQLSADDLLVPTTMKASLGSVLTVDATYRRSDTDASVSTVQYFGSITSSMGIYQATSTQNYSILQVADLGISFGKRMDISWNLNINEASYNSSIQLFASDNGTTLNQYLGPSVSFTPSDSAYKVLTGTFVPAHRYICVLCLTAKPSGIQTVRWYGLQLDEQGVDITALTMSAQGASQIPVLNDKKQLVGSGVSSSKVAYLDNVSSDIQTQLNSKLNLSGSNANQDIVLGGYKIQSSATPSVGNDLTPKSYVDSAISSSGALYVLKSGSTMTGDLLMGSNKVTSTADPTTSDTLTRKGWVDVQLALKANLAGNQTFTGTNTFNNSFPLILSGLTPSRVLILDASGNVTTSTVTPTTLSYLDATSSVQTQLNSKANLSGGNTFSGNQTFSNLITFSGYTAGRVLALGATSNLVATSTTLAQLSYLDATSSIQTQLDSKASTTYVDGQIATRVAKAGDTMTGLLTVNVNNGYSSRASNPLSSNIIASSSSGRLYMGNYYTGGVGTCSTIQSSDFYSSADHGTTLLINPLGGTVGINTDSPGAYQFYVNGTGAFTNTLAVGISGASANTTPNLLLSSSAQHVDNSSGQVYLFSATNGHIGLQRNTVRNATTACLALGTADTEQSEIISYKADGSTGYMPLAYAGSVHAWVAGNSTDTTLTSYSMLGQTGFDGSNILNLQCQASQYGRNQLIMTGRYEGANDAWAFTTPRNAIRFRTQSSLNSAYTNRWTIQNFADKLGFLSSSGGNTPRVVFTDGGLVGIGTDSPSTLLELIGSTTSFSVKDPTATSFSAMRLGNDSGYGCYWFLNGSSRSADGGVNTATLRNDLGDLRLHSAGGYGFTIDRLSGYTRQYGGDNSKILFGPNTTWSSYIVVGAGTNEVAANKAQLISTNGNWHQDAGLGKDTYINFYQGAPSQGNQPGSIYSYGLNWTHNGALTIGNAPSGYDRIVWSRTSNQPNIQMGDNFLSYASTNGSWTSDAIAGDMILRTGGSTIRLNTNGGGSSAFWASSTYVVINTGWKFSVGATGAQTIMGIGGGSTSGNVLNTGAWPNNANGMLISDSNNQNANTGGLFLGYGVDTGIINCLAPSVAWKYLYIYSGGMGIGWYGSMVAYTGPGGWTNISDEREKEDIQDLKTSSSLRRVLSLKPKHYLRKYYDQTNPMPEELKTQRCVGFLAQEVQQSNPHCVSEWENKEAKTEEDDGKRLGMSYNDYIVHLVGAVQEQQKTINLLSERNQILEDHARQLETSFTEYKLQTEDRFNKLATLIASLK